MNAPSRAPAAESSFAEEALRLGGKSEEEVRRTGAIDRADDQVERLFKQQYQTAQSPIHRAIWDERVPVDLFQSTPEQNDPRVQQVMQQSLDVVRRHREAKTLFDTNLKISPMVLEDLAGAGYWGLLVDPAYGGSGAKFRSFAPFLTRMATLDATVSGLGSVHGCIGAVDPVQTFGSAEQKQRLLPKLASGARLSAFALTEPNAGSDLTALRTVARRDGESFLVNGEKLFITNVVPGRTIGLVCLLDGKPAVLICDLPDQENDQFQFRKYGLYALKHTWNQGMIFRDFRVPAENLLVPSNGNGLTIAYHGLNLGRVALCANAAGSMRQMLASMVSWARFRVTYGESIGARELVRRRVGRLAGLIVACDALVTWCSGLIDQGFRGEMECIVAKIFGSEALKEAAVDLFMKTHGGRSFLHGHAFGDHVHEYLAPCIYEGEGEMLGMAFFKSLVKQHGSTYFEPVGRAFHAAGIQRPNLRNPLQVWQLRKALGPYAGWWLRQSLRRRSRVDLTGLPASLSPHVEFAAAGLQRQASEVSATLRKHQLKLADRQCRMSEISSRIQKLVVMLTTSLYAANSDQAVVREAADLLAQDLTRELTGERPSDRYFRQMTRFGETLVDGGIDALGVPPGDEILMRYER